MCGRRCHTVVTDYRQYVTHSVTCARARCLRRSRARCRCRCSKSKIPSRTEDPMTSTTEPADVDLSTMSSYTAPGEGHLDHHRHHRHQRGDRDRFDGCGSCPDSTVPKRQVCRRRQGEPPGATPLRRGRPCSTSYQSRAGRRTAPEHQCAAPSARLAVPGHAAPPLLARARLTSERSSPLGSGRRRCILLRTSCSTGGS